MGKLVEVQLREYAKPAVFDSNTVGCRMHDLVIVEAERGLDYGRVVTDEGHEAHPPAEGMVRRILRVVTAEDQSKISRNRVDIGNVFETTRKKIGERALPMKLISAEYSFDRSKIVFYFTAEGRVDFRELVRDLAQLFRARIELKQIGVRDEMKMFGGFGCCGRPLCCASFLKDFEPVTIRMAKQQNMPLSPEKISGCCGRLMCCLSYEFKTYKDLSRCLPKEGQMVETKEGKGKVLSVDMLRQLVLVEFADERKVEISYKEECEKFFARPQKKPEEQDEDDGEREK
ncbi:MAG: stage 0 sporulation family protein [Candidatus Omnitrophica bacterium]|nr:stage 0 sporulation family protein [Candidatus Omnitrophota bacterium]